MADAKLLSMGMPFTIAGTPSSSTFTINNASDTIEFIFSAQDAITITQLGTRVTVVTSPPVLQISLQGVNTSGRADGTIKASGNAKATWTPSATWSWQTLGSSYTCTRGEMLAIVVQYSSGTVGASNLATFQIAFGSTTYNDPVYITFDNDTTTTSRGSGLPCFGYASNSQAYGFPCSSSTFSIAYNSGSTPDEHAVKFTLPSWAASFQLVGARFIGNIAASATMTMKLYDTDGTTVLQDIAVDGDLNAGASRPWLHNFDESTLSTLTGGSTYTLGFVPDANNFTVMYLDVASSGDMAAFPGGTSIVGRSRVDAGAWTEIATRRYMVELFFADVTGTSGGGGGMVNRLIDGGLILA